MRHYIPSFAKLSERRFNRPQDAYDVMRVRDSWLAAQLADEVSTSSDFWSQTYGAWQKTFDRMQAKLSGDSWGACVAFYLTSAPR